MDILYIDNHLLAVNKPAGLVTQPSDAHPDSLECRAKAWIKAEFDKPGQVFLHAMHRLDRPVSGVVLFARTSKALSRVNASARAQELRKTYLAIVHGRPAESATLTHHLVHRRLHAEVVLARSKGAKEARLSYRRIAVAADSALLEIDLQTGRYHQIRAQLSAIGHPILGDHKYGSTARHEHIVLHHRTLVLPHPTKREPIAISAAPPPHSPWNQFPVA